MLNSREVDKGEFYRFFLERESSKKGKSLSGNEKERKKG